MTSSLRPGASRRPDPPYVRVGLYCVAQDGLRSAGAVSAGEELVLGLEVWTGGQPRELVVECWRGNCHRDRWVQQLEAGERKALAFRLHWSTSPGSARLTARVLIDGREVAKRTGLLGPGAVDAQGRLTDGSAMPDAGSATLMAFAEELARLLAGRARDSEK